MNKLQIDTLKKVLGTLGLIGLIGGAVLLTINVIHSSTTTLLGTKRVSEYNKLSSDILKADRVVLSEFKKQITLRQQIKKLSKQLSTSINKVRQLEREINNKKRKIINM